MAYERRRAKRLSYIAVAALLAACQPVKVPGSPASDSATSTDDSQAPQGTPDACDGHVSTQFCDGSTSYACDALADVTSSEDCAVSGEACQDGSGCLVCQPVLTVSYADSTRKASPGVFLSINPDAVSADAFGWEKFRMRPLVVTAPDAVSVDGVTLSADSDHVALYTTDGVAVTLPVTLTMDELPATFLMNGVSAGDTALSAADEGGTSCPTGDTVLVHVGDDPGLSGRPRTVAPYWESANTFYDTNTVYAGLDPVRYADRVGQPFQVDIVAHKTPEEWAADPSLVDVSGGVDNDTMVDGTMADDAFAAWSSDLDAGDGLGVGYDIVIDFGSDGMLDPGDLIDGLSEDTPGFYVLGDLTAAGSHTVDSFDWSGGTWLGQRVYYPDDIASMGELPLVVISHGNGHLYTWYDYLGDQLASWGYVVMAHQNNTEPGPDAASYTTLDNTDYLLQNLATAGGGVLDGHVDSHTIIWIGHSRGGEGVVRAYHHLVVGDYTPKAYTVDDIALISMIAPTVFYEVDTTNPHDIPLHLIAGSADGDVTGGADCPQCQYFRIVEAAQGPVQVTYVHGASHNDFNCCGFADATGPDLIGRDEAQTVAKGAFLALIQTYIDGNPATRDVLARQDAGFHPPGVEDTTFIVNTYRDAHVEGYPIFDDFQSNSDTALSSSGGVVETDASNVVEGQLADGDQLFGWADTDPMNGMTHAVYPSDLAQGAVFDWASDTTASYAEDVVSSYQDFTSYNVLSFAACQGTRHPYTRDLNASLDFTVTLVDSAGVESGINFKDQGGIPTPYPRGSLGPGKGWANEFATIRVPLTDFEIGSSINLRQVAQVRFDFGGDAGSTEGRLGLDNLELSR